MRIEEFAQRFFQNALQEGMWRYHGAKGLVEPLAEPPMPGASPVITLEILRGQASNQLQARPWFHQQQLWQDHASFTCEAHPPAIREALGKLHTHSLTSSDEFTMQDMVAHDLTGCPASADRRAAVGGELICFVPADYV